MFYFLQLLDTDYLITSATPIMSQVLPSLVVSPPKMTPSQTLRPDYPRAGLTRHDEAPPPVLLLAPLPLPAPLFSPPDRSTTNAMNTTVHEISLHMLIIVCPLCICFISPFVFSSFSSFSSSPSCRRTPNEGVSIDMHGCIRTVVCVACYTHILNLESQLRGRCLAPARSRRSKYYSTRAPGASRRAYDLPTAVLFLSFLPAPRRFYQQYKMPQKPLSRSFLEIYSFCLSFISLFGFFSLLR